MLVGDLKIRLIYSGFGCGIRRDSDVCFDVFYAAIEEVDKLRLK